MTTPNKTEMLIKWAAMQKQMNDLEELISQMPDDKPKQWEPQGGEWYIDESGGVRSSSSTPESKHFGTERPTEELAEKAAKQMRIHNRLLAYVHEHVPDYESDWDDPEKYKYYVQFNHITGTWYSAYDLYCETAGAVYMSQEVAEDLADKLNSGEVVL